jgi:hypothetical protein
MPPRVRRRPDSASGIGRRSRSVTRASAWGAKGKRILTVLRLATKKPWAIDVAYFTPVKRPLYLTGLAVAVTHQGQRLGRLAIEDARAVAANLPHFRQ